MIPFALLLSLLSAGAEPRLIGLLAEELDRAKVELSSAPDPPYYLAVTVRDIESLQLAAISGTLADADHDRYRTLDVELRVGDPQFDSEHPLRGGNPYPQSSRRPVEFPLDDEPELALRHALWREIDRRYRTERIEYSLLRSEQAVKVEEEDPAADFEPRTGKVQLAPSTPLRLEAQPWETILATVSDRLDAHPEVEEGRAALSLRNQTTTFVDSEGSRLLHGGGFVRLSLAVGGTAADGDALQLAEHLDFHSPDRLPEPASLLALADGLVARLAALLAAPRGEPYSGPVMLRGRAAAVFFHEVLGHRVEGHRQKLDWEGKTFRDAVGRAILPATIDVYDDPTLSTLAGTALLGHYRFDDQGVAAQRAPIVDDGILVGFLMGRSPIQGFPHSNGHGRASPGRSPVSRMGNLVVESADGVPQGRLRELLLQAVRRQGLPYGVVVDEIAGGFTHTGRRQPNAFSVRALGSWRIFADGRPDQLIRGIDLVGTPLEAFGSISALGDQGEVFNGFCGAESGYLPVSATSPSVLFRSLEFQLREKSSERPPLLPKPVTEAADEKAASRR